MPIDGEHYKKCFDALTRIIEDKIPAHRKAIDAHTRIESGGGTTFPVYESGYDPNSYLEVTVGQILSSPEYGDLYGELTSKKDANNFELFGKEFNIDIKHDLDHILRVGILLYNVINRYEEVEKQFKELYYSIFYSDQFELKLTTVIKNFDSASFTLLSSKDQLTVAIEKQTDSTLAINYSLHDKKNNRYHIWRQPGTVIDIIVGMLRIYTSPNIDYFVSGAEHPIGCPVFIKTNAPQWYEYGFTIDPPAYTMNDDERGGFMKFVNIVMQSEERVVLAIQRFSMACDRESDYDKLLDLVFTLEILLGDSNVDSIKHKIVLRLLNLLSSKKEVRKELYDSMSSLYDARSTLVHGGHKKPKFFIAIANLENYIEIIRMGLLIFIKTMAIEKLNYENMSGKKLYEKMFEKLDYDKEHIHEIDMSKILWAEGTKVIQ